MKNLKIIVLLLLTQNYIQSADADTVGFYKDETSEPNTTIIYRITKKEVPDQELSRKVDPETGRTIIHRLTSNPHYQPKAIPAEPDYTGVRFPTLKTRDDYVDPELLEREEKLKKLRQQEKAAKKIQTEWRLRKKLKKVDDKLPENINDKKHKHDVWWNKLHLTVKIKTLADQSYPQFKELICTSDYLTKTDWLYQFIEAAENKTIFERNSDGTINSEEFTPEFKKEIENPSDWLDDKITKYLPEFHDLVYEAFIDKAVEQIVKYKISWADAVSIPTPKGHGSFQEEGTPLFPKIYKSSDSDDHTLILGKIFVKILEQDPKKFEQLHFQDFIKFDKYPKWGPDYFYVKIFNRVIQDIRAFDGDQNSSPDERSLLLKNIKVKNPEIDTFVLKFFYEYLTSLGLELSPEEEKQLHENFKWPENPQWNSNTEPYEEYQKRNDDFYKRIDEISEAERKFIDDHINWASSARQTFYLGQLLFDKSLTAFDALGGQEWFEKQPQDIQEYIANYIEKLKTAQKQYALKKHVATENNSTTDSLTAWNTRLNNAFKGGMRSMWSKKE